MNPESRRLAVVALLVALPVGAADPRPRLLVAPVVGAEGVSEKSAARWSAVLQDALRGREEIELAELGGAPEAVAVGKKALEERRFERAVEALQEGVQRQLAEPASVDLAQLTDAYLALATALFRLGEEREAKEALQALVRLSPSLHLGAGHPPAFRRELERARARAQRRPKGALSIDGPRGARALVDGRSVGRVPVLLEGLGVGAHLVRVDGEHGERFGALVEVKPGLAKVRAIFAAPPVVLDEAELSRLAELTAAAGASHAVVAAIARGTGERWILGLALYSRERRGLFPMEPVSIEADDAVAGPRLRRQVDELLRRLGPWGPPATLPVQLLARASAGAPEPAAAPTGPPADLATKPATMKLEPRPQAMAQPTPAAVATASSSAPAAQAAPPPPAWVWVVAGVAAAAGLGVGGYLGYQALRPATGTVSASW